MSGTRLGTVSRTSATISQAATIKVIDVTEKPATANVVRDGRQVPAVTIDATRLKDWIDVGVIRPIEDTRRVVTQTIAAGTRVARGTAVDLMMAEPGIIPIDVLDRPHLGLRDRGFTMAQVTGDFLADPTTRVAVLNAETVDQLSGADQQRIRTAFLQRDVSVVDDDPGRNLDAAFRTLKSAAAFR